MRLALATLTILLTGCVSQPQRPSSSGDIARPLVSPSTLGYDRTVNQIVRGAFGEREMTMNCVVTVKDGVMTIVGVTAMGIRVFTMKYDGRATSVDNTLPIPAQLTPERLLADFQLVFWPLEALKQPLAAAGWELSESSPGTRRLRRDTRLIAEVHHASADPWSGRSWLVNLEHGYTLNIESKAM